MIFSAYKLKCYVTLLCMISKKMTSDLYMLSIRVLHGIFFLYAYGTSIITFNKYIVKR